MADVYQSRNDRQRDDRPPISTICNRQSSIVNRQSSIVNRQSSIVNRQSSIVNRQSSIVGRLRKEEDHGRTAV
ncbi:MAG: hypothetical protein R3E79_48190 [Caldilineaceae bacterium]